MVPWWGVIIISLFTLAIGWGCGQALGKANTLMALFGPQTPLPGAPRSPLREAGNAVHERTAQGS